MDGNLVVSLSMFIEIIEIVIALIIGYFIGKGAKPKSYGDLLLTKDPVDGQVYLSLDIEPGNNPNYLKDNQVIQFKVKHIQQK